MSYYISKRIESDFDAAVKQVTGLLNEEGFGILTDIDVKATMKKKMNLDYGNYRILGACNPPFANQALQAEPMIGTLLPCNVIVRETGKNQIDIAAINPMESMRAVENESLMPVALGATERLQRVIDRLQ